MYPVYLFLQQECKLGRAVGRKPYYVAPKSSQMNHKGFLKKGYYRSLVYFVCCPYTHLLLILSVCLTNRFLQVNGNHTVHKIDLVEGGVFPFVCNTRDGGPEKFMQ